MAPINILDGLSPRQREAVQHENGPLLIVAGPGSGKTRVMAHRVAYLITERDVAPWRILAVTFTNKAARELRERCNSLVPESADALQVRTFHSFCAQVLRMFPESAGLEPGYSIYDDDDQARTVRRVLDDLEIDQKQFPPRTLMGAISDAKNRMIGPDVFASTTESYREEVAARVYERYEAALKAANSVDFDDLLLKVFLMLEGNADLREQYQDRYEYLLVDEFQDTNPLQFHIARLLSGSHRNICVVGDPDQSIYSWRNADPSNLVDFQSTYADATVVTLDQSYRSTQLILEAADAVIANNETRLEKHLWTDNDRGRPVALAEAYDEREEARIVLDEVEKLFDTEGVPRGEMAVMYRINAQSRAMEVACNRRGLPYRLVGGVKFYQRKEIRDTLSFLRLVNNPADDAALERIINVPARGISQRSMLELRRVAQAWEVPLLTVVLSLEDDSDAAPDNGVGAYDVELNTRARKAVIRFAGLIKRLIEQSLTLQPPDLIDLALERSGYARWVLEDKERGDERMENLKELRGSSEQFAVERSSAAGADPRELLGEFLQNVALVSDVDALEDADGRGDAITLITLHQAKGLEFDAVFMLGLEEGLLPHSRSIEDQDPAKLEEERRLCYVGMTRARKYLYMLHAFNRNFRGRTVPGIRSRFLEELPQSLITRSRVRGMRSSSTVTDRLIAKELATIPAPKAATGPRIMFQSGDRVRHDHFGEGVVVSARDQRGDTEVTVAFEGQGVKRLMLNFAPLTNVSAERAADQAAPTETVDSLFEHS